MAQFGESSDVWFSFHNMYYSLTNTFTPIPLKLPTPSVTVGPPAFFPPAFWLIGEEVRLHGIFEATAGPMAAGTTLAILPDGVRPLDSVVLKSRSNSGSAPSILKVLPDGRIVLTQTTGVSMFASLDSTSFDIVIPKEAQLPLALMSPFVQGTSAEGYADVSFLRSDISAQLESAGTTTSVRIALQGKSQRGRVEAGVGELPCKVPMTVAHVATVCGLSIIRFGTATVS